MRRSLAAIVIALICFAVIAAHAWWTWGEIDGLPSASAKDREFFQYSLFVESFAFMVSAAYFCGPRIYRLFREEKAAQRFEGEKKGVSNTVEIYSAAGVMLRRLSLDHRMGVPTAETVTVIALICAPAVWAILSKKYAPNKKPA